MALSVQAVSLAGPGESGHEFKYPETRKSDQVDDYHGVKVPDPYRWLENPDSTETRAWIESENKVTNAFLNSIPERDKIQRRLTEIWDYERFGIPFKKGGRYFINRNDGLQNQYVLFTMKNLKDEPVVLLDPNKLSSDGTVAVSGTSASKNGKFLAYGTSQSGSDWQEWRVRDIESGEDLPDHIKWVKFSGASWSPDSKGFYYSRYDEPDEDAKYQGVNYFQKLYYHALGTPQSEDILVYERPDHKDWGFGGTVTDDGRYLIISVWRGTERKNLVFYKDLKDAEGPIVELIPDFESSYSFIDNDGTTFWFQTDNEAPKHRVIAIDISKPQKEHWEEIIPPSRDTLRRASVVGDHFIGSYLSDARSVVKIFSLKGERLRKVDLPDIGTARGFGGKRDDSETFYSFTNFIDPGTIYRYDVKTGQSEVFRKPEVDFDPKDYQIRQVHCYTKDQTRVPIFLCHKKGIRRDGSNPTYLYGYGGFNIAITPSFNVSNLVWMEMGGIYAVANIRGGGEFGKEWHQAGTKLQKQNCFDDFIAAAEFLVEHNLTSPGKLAIGGGSNGGLLVGACMTQRPDLFGAAIPAVGVLDMLRFQKFTIGWAWVSDYGSSDNADEFNALYKYSPLHNLKPGTRYPSTMIMTADHDDRVVPAHSFKFAAALQAAHKGDNPTVIRIQTKAGHGAGKPTKMQIEEQADKWAFLVKTLGMDAILRD
ncbi:MAG: prolyl oligopeptidase family serine peptidase [Planctomycetota bacterium]